MNDHNSEDLRRTPLYNSHAKLNAKFVPFGGWEMPVQYSSIIEEHRTVRTAVGIFDVSHMGEVLVAGSGARAFLQRMVTNDVSKIQISSAQYSMLLNEEGGVVDDLIIYRLKEEEYLLCVNASNTEKDYKWICSKVGQEKVSLENLSSEYAQIAVQGPNARKLCARAFAVSEESFLVSNFKSFTLKHVPYEGRDLLVVSTGYTGEDGFEIFIPADKAAGVWDSLMDIGADLGVKPIGLGARDTLRFEACLPLHGHEIRDDLDPITSGLSWAICFEKDEFIGKSKLLPIRDNGPKKRLVGLEVVDRGIVRDGAKVFAGNREIGWVTSGTFCPTLNKACALAVVESSYAEVGTKLGAQVRDKMITVEVIKKPFYRRSNGR